MPVAAVYTYRCECIYINIYLPTHRTYTDTHDPPKRHTQTHTTHPRDTQTYADLLRRLAPKIENVMMVVGVDIYIYICIYTQDTHRHTDTHR